MRTYNSKTEDERPEASHGMGLDRLCNGHLVLAILSVEGIAHEVRVDQNFGLLNVMFLQLIRLDRRRDLGWIMLLVGG